MTKTGTIERRVTRTVGCETANVTSRIKKNDVSNKLNTESGKEIHDALKRVSRNREFYQLFEESVHSKNWDVRGKKIQPK
uniref:Uncharacterized protein n=1 Tax=Romanomermis culicivorax TaxID=13658 RepID=A0A915HKY3_ROMCU